MESKYRKKMPPAQRAKQFMPFAALRGLPEALRNKEKIQVARIILSEDMAEELNRKMLKLEGGKKATLIYYNKEEYLQITGMISKIDKDFRVIRIVDTNISFDDILDIT